MQTRAWLTAILVLACAGRAEADPVAKADDGGDFGTYFLLGALAANASFTIYDLATLGDDKPGIYGAGETLVAAPQTLLFGSLAVIARDSDEAWIPATLAVWTAALAAHGIYTLATEDDEPAPSARTVMLSFGSAF